MSCCRFTLPSDADGFRVRAVNSAGAGEWSRSVSVPVERPGRVASVGSRSSEYGPLLYWQPVSGAASYDIDARERPFDRNEIRSGITCHEASGECGYLFKSDSHTSQAFRDATQFRIRAVNSAGRSNWSEWVEVPVAVPGVPSGVRFSSGQAAWNSVSGATSYEVISGPDNGESVIRSGLSCCRFTLPSDADGFRVRAVNDAGAGEWSRSVPVLVTQPGPVLGVRYSSGRAVWNAVPGATSYVVRLWYGDAGNNVEGVTCCRYTFDSTHGITHFTIRAVNRAGGGPWSEWVEVTSPPMPPRNLKAVSHGTNQFKVTWSPPSNSGSSPISRYEIQYSRAAIDSSGPWSTSTTVTGTYHVSNTRTRGIRYDISVTAINRDGRRSVPTTTSVSLSAPSTPTPTEPTTSNTIVPKPSRRALQLPRHVLQIYYTAAVAQCPSRLIDWTVLAAIAGIESKHGTYSNTDSHRKRKVRTDMTIVYADTGEPATILGVPLMGQELEIGGERVVHEGILAGKFAGKYGIDDDAVYMQVVGPFQFRPDTWEENLVRYNPIGQDPQNFEDAAHGAAAKLCFWAKRHLDRNTDSSTRDDKAKRFQALSWAILRYNPDYAYVRLIRNEIPTYQNNRESA